MLFETSQGEMYHKYDVIVGKTVDELIGYAQFHNSIRLMGFDRKNKEHLFILRIALMVRDLYNIPVEIGCSWLDGIVINWKIRKGFKKVDIINRFAYRGIWVPSLIGRIKSEAIEYYGFSVCLDNIYDAYYEGSCG